MQDILLHDTPVIVPYFYNFLAAGNKKVTGYKGRCTRHGLPESTPRSRK